jgi:hypothetical protein
VESALEEVGLPWRRRAEGWVVPAGASLPREITLRPLPGGLRVEAILLAWDELGEAELAALAWFLCRAQHGLRFARCELADRQARVAALVRVEELGSALPHALMGVATGTRLLAREVGALLLPELARAYVEFFGTGEKPALSGRKE